MFACEKFLRSTTYFFSNYFFENQLTSIEVLLPCKFALPHGPYACPKKRRVSLPVALGAALLAPFLDHLCSKPHRRADHDAAGVSFEDRSGQCGGEPATAACAGNAASRVVAGVQKREPAGRGGIAALTQPLDESTVVRGLAVTDVHGREAGAGFPHAAVLARPAHAPAVP